MKFSRFFSGFISFLLIFTITFQVVALPFSQPKKAEASAVSAMLKDFVGDAATGIVSCAATWGISFAINEIMGLITDVPSTDKNTISRFIQDNCLKPIAKQIALGVLQKLTESTVNWINGGFKGNPFYIRDLGAYLTSVTDEAVSKISYDIKISDSPYSINLSAGLINSYLGGQQTKPPEYSLNNILGQPQAEAFSGGDFSKGGWDGWLATTIVPQNNKIGASFLVSDMATRELAKKTEEQKEDLSQNDGFLSMKKCLEPTSTPDGPGCDKYETVTPGSLISEQLGETSNNSKDQLLSTEDLAETFMAVFSALLTSITTDGVSSLSSTSGSSNFGGYGSNDPSQSTSPAGTIPGWTTAGGNGQDIDLDNLQDYVDLMQEIIDKTNILLPKMKEFIEILYEADYCVPGPRVNWYDLAQDNMRGLLSNINDSATAGEARQLLYNIFKIGVVIDVDQTFPGYGDDVKLLTSRALDGWKEPEQAYRVSGYKDHIEKYYSMADNIPVAFSINKEFKEVDDYEILLDYNKKRAEQAAVFISRITFLQRIYDSLPNPIPDPIDEPALYEDYLEKRAELQKDADSILAGIYTKRALEGVEGQIIDMDAKKKYMTNTDPAVGPNGLLPQCIEEIKTWNAPKIQTTPVPGYPPTNRVPVNRRPYPTRLLPQAKQDFLDNQVPVGTTVNKDTFLPFVRLGPTQDWPVPDGTTPVDEFYWDYLYFVDLYGVTENYSVSTTTNINEPCGNPFLSQPPCQEETTTVVYPGVPDPRQFEDTLKIY